MPKTIAASIALLVIGLVLGARGLYVWNGCGYDCPAMRYPSITATAAMLYGAISVAVGFFILIAAILSANGRRKGF